jgi:hypothetical protein
MSVFQRIGDEFRGDDLSDNAFLPARDNPPDSQKNDVAAA